MSQVGINDGLWEGVLESLRDSYSPDIFNTWFEPVSGALQENGMLLLRVPNPFVGFWIEDNFLGVIKERATSISSEVTGVEILIEDEAPVVERQKKPEIRTSGSRVAKEPSRQIQDRIKAGNGLINPRNTFENFIVGPSNQLAHAASTAVASAPGASYNPLFLYGDTGLGKTHLMHAVAHTIQQQDPDARVVYLSCEKFTNKFLRAIRENSLDSFRRLYRKVDVLLIDDIQFLEGKERTQEEFFHTFNELFESQKQLCLSSDRPASEMNKLESRLVSRFQWGMVTDIQPPDLETRVAILKKKGQSMGFHNLEDEILEFLATRITRNVRRLEGALLKVATYGQIVKSPITIRMVEDLVHDILQEESQNQITIEKVQRKVAEYFDLRMSDMLSKRRPTNIAFPRQIAMYLSRILTNHPLKEIGDSFGGRDHGTVIHACKTVENIMEQDENVRRNVDYLSRQLSGSQS